MLYFQLVIMAGTVLLAYYFECTDTFQVHIQGFFCQDGDLMKPYPGTEEESFITPLVLYCVLAATPTAIIFIGEISMYFIKSTRESLIAQEKTILTGECCYLNPLLRRIIRFVVMSKSSHQHQIAMTSMTGGERGKQSGKPKKI
uniref:Phospholipid phosphatase related 1 n=1 Tax=Molossus molossus TaxID=27622 RepID=A0A7J8EFX3_MOLMO|nr:phospholipid phosphatase related 1 [Molossus molossus]